MHRQRRTEKDGQIQLEVRNSTVAQGGHLALLLHSGADLHQTVERQQSDLREVEIDMRSVSDLAGKFAPKNQFAANNSDLTRPSN